MTVLERPQVADAIVHGPHRLCFNRSLGQRDHHGANLALVAFLSVEEIAMQQAGHPEGEEQPVLVEEVQRGHRISRANIDGAGRGEAQRLNGKADRGRHRRFIGKAVDEALFDQR